MHLPEAPFCLAAVSNLSSFLSEAETTFAMGEGNAKLAAIKAACQLVEQRCDTVDGTIGQNIVNDVKAEAKTELGW